MLVQSELNQVHAALVEAVKPGAVPSWLQTIFKILGPSLLAAAGPTLTQVLGPLLGPVVFQLLTSLLGGSGIVPAPPPTPAPVPEPGMGSGRTTTLHPPTA